MPNELYIGWLKEWMDKAYDVQSKGYQTLRKAHDSMKACPLEIGHPSQAAQLKYIGPILCARLEKTMIAHCKEHDIPMPERPVTSRSNPEEDDMGAPPKKKRAVKAYVPTYRSGPYALLMGLSEPSARDNMPKSDVVRLSQPFCDTSFEIPSDQRGFYTAWNSMKTLIDKELVHKAGSPPKYTITDSGIEIATRLRATPDPSTVLRDQNTLKLNLAKESPPRSEAEIVIREKPEEPEAPEAAPGQPIDFKADFEPISVSSGTFKIQLIIDNREVKTQRDRIFIEEQLFNAGIELVARTLEVGDALWIAKCDDGREFVLDHIVERKRMDDLVSSIKDGRFHEQKFRLQRCGARQVIYVIEESNLQDVIGYQEAIQTALSSTQVVNGFFVKRVQSLDYTIRYLVKLTKRLKTFYESQTLRILPDYMVDSRTFTNLMNHLCEKDSEVRYYLSYAAFSGLTVKSVNLQVGDLWLRMLMTIRGVSAEKAIEIQSRFPTLSHLLQAYDACPSQLDRDKLMTVTCTGYGRKAIGQALSKKIASFLS